MDIACPTCAAAYEIDDASMTETGRKVRCAECGTVWRTYRDGSAEIMSSPAPAPAPAPVAAYPPSIPDAPSLEPTLDDIAATPELPVSPGDLGSPATETTQLDEALSGPGPRARAEIVSGKKKQRKSAGTGFLNAIKPPVLLLCTCAALLVGAFIWRNEVVRLLPQSASVFNAIGTPVNLRGIEIRNVHSRMVEDNGVNVLVIDGDLVNLRTEPAHVPRLRFAVLSDKGQEIFSWTAQADRGSLKPGETLNFRRRLAAPPSDGRDVTVRFHTVSDITAGLK